MEMDLGNLEIKTTYLHKANVGRGQSNSQAAPQQKLTVSWTLFKQYTLFPSTNSLSKASDSPGGTSLEEKIPYGRDSVAELLVWTLPC